MDDASTEALASKGCCVSSVKVINVSTMSTPKAPDQRKPVKRKPERKRPMKKTKKARLSHKDEDEEKESGWDTEVSVDSNSTLSAPRSPMTSSDSETEPGRPKLQRQDAIAAWYFNKSAG